MNHRPLSEINDQKCAGDDASSDTILEKRRIIHAKSVVVPVKSVIDGVKSAIDLAKSLIDDVKSVIDDQKSLIDGVKSVIDGVNYLIIPAKSLIRPAFCFDSARKSFVLIFLYVVLHRTNQTKGARNRFS